MTSFSQKILEYFENNMRLWLDKNFLLSAILSFSLLYLATIINSMAGILATERASNYVNDIVLSNIPRMDTSFIHGEITGLVRDITLFLLFLTPRYLPFAMKTMAVLTVVRAGFINMTNIGIYPDSIPINSLATFGGDLFFSGHVATSYLMSLVFWDRKFLRYFFLSTAIIFGISALLGHYHYTIDVFAAPFIAYGVFTVCSRVFVNDFNMLKTRLFTAQM
ncbi:MAG: phosphatase PAP2-related protein [Candidatus Paceibacterota bacterium]|jgi:hypothetical protein